MVGSFMLYLLLLKGHKVFCLVRKNPGVSSRKRVVDVLKFWGGKNFLAKKHLRFLNVIDGDITKVKLGVSSIVQEKLCREINAIFHFAALTNFKCSSEILTDVNIRGTRNILDFGVNCLHHGNRVKVYHMSTAYVCGSYKGRFSEADFDLGQSFTIPYEWSKFEAEKIVRQYRGKGLEVDILRAPAIIGEAATGKALTFSQSFYQALRILSKRIFSELPCKNTSFNIVFIDDLCKSIYRIFSKSTLKNSCYHLFNSTPLPVDNFLLLASKFLRIKAPKFIYPNRKWQKKLTATERAILKFNFSFLSRKLKLDSRKTNRYLQEIGFQFLEYKNNHLKKILFYMKNSKAI